jgi:hypothetical protein
VRRSLLVCLLAACDGGLFRDAAPADARLDGAAFGSCPVAGEWALARISCGADDVTAEYLGRVPSTRLSLAAGATGCAGTLRAASDFCAETETFTAEVTASSWTVSSNGITECSFEGCLFGFDDVPCLVGDRAGMRSENVSFGPNSFTTARFGQGTICAPQVAQVIVWTKL